MANAKSIRITPEELRGTVGTIRGKAETYKDRYTHLYSRVDYMASSWEGKDNLEYVQQIRAFRPQLEKMEQLMRDYAQFLESAANAFDDVQGQIVSRAQSLVN